LTDDTGSILSPIVWAATREPFIAYLRSVNAFYLVVRAGVLAVGCVLYWLLHMEIGLWLLVASGLDFCLCATCELGARRVMKDIVTYAKVGGVE
jgi:hypothetical protein